MVYQGDATGQDIVTLCDDYAKSNSTSYPIARKTRMANAALKIIWSWIFQVFGGWIFDDKNYTSLPEATTTISSGQNQYTLPTATSDLFGVSILNQSGNSYDDLIPVTLEEIQEMGYSEASFMTTSGNPRYYRPIADGFKIYPAANYTILNTGIKAIFSRSMVLFSTTDTNVSPGFDSNFHEAVPVYMALQYAQISTLKNSTELRKLWSNERDANYPPGYEQRIKSFYLARFRQKYPQTIKTHDITSEFI